MQLEHMLLCFNEVDSLTPGTYLLQELSANDTWALSRMCERPLVMQQLGPEKIVENVLHSHSNIQRSSESVS